jgi:hypothetical protein
LLFTSPPVLAYVLFQEGLTFEANIERAPIPTNRQTHIWIDEPVFMFPTAQISGFLLVRKKKSIFFFARHAISFLMTSPSTAVVSSHCPISSQTRSRLFHFNFSAAASCNSYESLAKARRFFGKYLLAFAKE